VGRILHIGLPAHRKREHSRVQGKGIEHRVQPILVNQHQADEHQAAGEEV